MYSIFTFSAPAYKVFFTKCLMVYFPVFIETNIYNKQMSSDKIIIVAIVDFFFEFMHAL